jgi:hypothetical protein
VSDLLGDDLSRSYQDYRVANVEDDALRRLRAMTGPATGAARAATDQPAEQPAEPAAPARQPGVGVRALRAGGAVLRNAGDAVMQVPAGAMDGMREVFRAGDSLADLLAGTTAQTAPDTPGRMIARGIDAVNPFPQPSTPAGEMSREVSQFLFGFWRGAGLMRRAGVAQGEGAAAAAVRGLGAGAIADFFFNEADEGNLANAWRQAGLPANALTDYLAAKPGDTEAENRLRNAATGTLTGAALEGVLATVRGVRAATRTRAAMEEGNARVTADAVATVPEVAGVAPNAQRDLMLLGDAGRPLVEVQPRGDVGARMAEAAGAVAEAGDGAAPALTGVAGDMATGGVLSGRQEAPQMFINWGRIQTADDVQGVMRDMAEAYRPQIDEARRGVQTNEETARLAAQMGMRPEDILSRARGEPWNAETALAARQLYTASGEQLLASARLAAAPGAGALEAAAFRRMMATHYAIQAQVVAARTETARALQSWAIPAGSGREQMRAIEQMLEGSGGQQTAAAMARRMAMLSDNLPPDEVGAALAAFTRRGWAGASLEAVQEVWINALLSSPTTHIVNVTSNTVNAFLQVAERGGAEAVSRMRNAAPGDGVMPGEALALTYGLVTGMRDAMRLAARTYRDETGELGAMLGKVDLPRDPSISARAFGVDEGSGLGRSIDFLGHSVVRQPGRFMGAEDAFFKSILFRSELHASSLREAYGRLAARGETATMDALGREMALVVRDPPEHVRMAAADQALYATFNRQAGPIAQGLLVMRNTDSPAFNLSIAFILPFIRTPMNILSYSFERTPLAPLVGQWRADMAAGGARADLATARVAMGTTMMALAFDMADRGLITGRGPDDAPERANLARAGVQPYSVRVGDSWVSYNRLDPFGFLLGFAADVADMVRRADVEPDEIEQVDQLMAAGALTVSRAVLDRSWMSGAANFFAAMDESRPSPERFMQQVAGSLLVPAAVAAAERIGDPVQREAMGIEEAVLARIPGLSAQLIPRRTLWGEEMRPGLRTVAGSEGAAAVVNALTPAAISPRVDSPIDRELVRLNLSIEPIGRDVAWNAGAGPSVSVRMRAFPQALDEYRRLAGNGLKLEAFDGLGLRDLLNETVQGRGPLADAYSSASDGEDGGKARLIQRVVRTYRDAARRAVLDEPANVSLRGFVEERQRDAAERRMPVLQ